jgi:hypothetical protein
MSENRPQTEEQLTQQWASTIGESVEQLMNRSGWTEANNDLLDPMSLARAGQPGEGGVAPGQPTPSGPPAVTPAPAPTAAKPVAPAQSQEAIDWEAIKRPDGTYAGKYTTRQAAVEGMAHVVQMSKDAYTRAEAVERENAELRRRLADSLRQPPVVTPATAPEGASPLPTRGDATKPSPKLDAVLASLQDEVLDGEKLTKLTAALREQAVEDARQAMRDELSAQQVAADKERARWMKVESFMATKYPESVKFTDELGLFVKANPLISAGVTGLMAQDRHEEAMEAAWLAFNKTHSGFIPAPATKENVEKEIKLDAADQVRKEAVEAARKDAGIIGSGGAATHGVHESTQLGPSQEEMDRAVALERQGHGEEWRRLVFRDILNHPIFGN